MLQMSSFKSKTHPPNIENVKNEFSRPTHTPKVSTVKNEFFQDHHTLPKYQLLKMSSFRPPHPPKGETGTKATVKVIGHNLI